MTKLMDWAVEVARRLSDDQQDDIAQIMLQLAGETDESVIALSDAERIAIEASKKAAARRIRHRRTGAASLGQTRSVRIRYTDPALADYPAVNSPTDDPDIRRLVVTPYPYLVFYQVFESEVLIHTIRYAARDPSTMPGHSGHTP